ncbi:carbohydrate ABC transporter permease [Phycicoccus avicenniae]|nr:sugar ABC transporter permease [Phycicoccus avicenniae]
MLRPTFGRRPSEGGGRGPRGAGGRREEAVAGWLLALPFVVVFLVFSLWPMLWSLFMSFTDMTNRDLRSPFNVEFIGFDNFVTVLSSGQFLRGIVNTLVIVVVGVPATIVLGLLLAVALNNGIQRAKPLFRTIYYVPVVTTVVAIAVVWKFLFADQGVFNAVLATVGVDGRPWLTDTFWALPTIILLIVWRSFGFIMVLFLAGLQAIPQDLYDAARVDGASAPRRLFSITVPLLMPTILLAMVLQTVSFLEIFEEPFVTTQGGPLNSTATMSMLVYEFFGFGAYGEAAAASYVLFAIIGLLSLVQFRVLRSRT